VTATPSLAAERRGEAEAARASMVAANSLTAGLSEREANHIAFFDLRSAGDTEAGISALTSASRYLAGHAMFLSSAPPPLRTA